MNSLKAVVMGSALVSAVSAASFTNSTTSALPMTTATGGVVYTTQVVTAFTTYCPEATVLTVGNRTITVTSATTLTITDCPCTIKMPVYTNVPGEDQCAKKCNYQYEKCSVAPDANHSYCASQLATCVGYNPFNGGYVKPTSCQGGNAGGNNGGSSSGGNGCSSGGNCGSSSGGNGGSSSGGNGGSSSGGNGGSSSGGNGGSSSGGNGGSSSGGNGGSGSSASGGAGGATSTPVVTAGAGQQGPALALLALAVFALF